MAEKAVVIGAGFAGLSTASLLAGQGYSVTILEKNSETGGRARAWKQSGFSFDMGPSWYLMPDVFDAFFSTLGRRRDEYYNLKKLSPFYKVFFEKAAPVTITDNHEENRALFDSFEPLGGIRLDKYLGQAKYKYDVSMHDFLYKDFRSISRFFNRRMLTEGLRLNLFSGLDSFVSRYFQDTRAKQILEYAMVFLGTRPGNAPALYSIMSHVDLSLGVYYPEGGLAGAAEGFHRLAVEMGAVIETGTPVSGYDFTGDRITNVRSGSTEWKADIVVDTADYHHAETALLPRQYHSYSDRYWKKRTLAPSMFIIYLGLGHKLKSVEHHNLYFSENWDEHFSTIFDSPSWPENPCFYMSCNSKTDRTSAPEGGENIFILVPAAPGLADTDEIRETYAEKVISHVENVTGEDLHNDVKIRRIYSQRDFTADYNAWKGTALGLAHTLLQTAVFRPAHRSKKLKNLYYSGQYTHPGVGVPMAVISSQVVADMIGRN